MGADIFLSGEVGVVDEGAALASIGRELAGGGIFEALDDGLGRDEVRQDDDNTKRDNGKPAVLPDPL